MARRIHPRILRDRLMRSTMVFIGLLCIGSVLAQKNKKAPSPAKAAKEMMNQAETAFAEGRYKDALHGADDAMRNGILDWSTAFDLRGRSYFALGDSLHGCRDIARDSERKGHGTEQVLSGRCFVQDSIHISMDPRLIRPSDTLTYLRTRTHRFEDRTEYRWGNDAGAALEFEVRGQDTLYRKCEQQPTFPEGEAALFKFLGTTIRYPAQAQDLNVSGVVYARFVVLPDGRVDDPTIVRGPGFGLPEEVLRVLREMPDWEPAQHNEKAVPFEFFLPVRFSLR